MLFKGVLITQASGRLGDSVWAHNRGGPYVRAMGNPNPNPPSTNQTVMREAIESAWLYWLDTMTAADRALWQEFADGNGYDNRIGDRRKITGWNEFSRVNILRYFFDNVIGSSLSAITLPPALPNAIWDTTPVIETLNATEATIVLTPEPLWFHDFPDTVGVAVWASPALNATRLSHRVPYTFNTLMNRSLTGSTVTVTLPFGTAPQHWWLRFKILREDGSVSPFRFVDVPCV